MRTSRQAKGARVLMVAQDVEVTRRILQEARTLTEAGYDVSILTRAPSSHDLTYEIDGLPVEALAVTGRDTRFGWLYRLAGEAHGTRAAALWSVLTGRHTFNRRALPRAVAHRADIYHAHDLNNLQVAYSAARETKAKLVYDAHELFPELANRWVALKKGAWSRLENKLIREADLTITVNELIAGEMSRRYGIVLPLVILNYPDPPAGFDLNAKHDHIRARLGLSLSTKVVLYQGWMSRGRGLENLVRCAPLLAGEAAVVFMGYGNYRGTLERLAAREGGGRVFFIDAVPQKDLIEYCASADVGVIPYQAVDLNNYYTSPNKLFDFIQAALPIVASDLPYLAKVIVDNDIGVVRQLDDARSYANGINCILGREDGGEALRANLRRVAPNYTWGSQTEKLLAAYATL